MQLAKYTFYFAPYLLSLLLPHLLKIKICASQQFKSPYTGDVNVADFSVDDIFNSDLIPVKIITDQLGLFLNYTGKETLPSEMAESLCFNTTDLNTAVKAMRFHRHMMNEYLLSGYLTKEIMGSLPTTINFSEAIEKRSGKAKNSSYVDNFNVNSESSSLPSNHKLIEDEGSTQYATWLKRINTYEDIQKQLMNKRKEHNERKKKIIANRRQSLSINLDPNYSEADVDDGLDYLEDGDITGYAFTNNPTEETIPINWHKMLQKSRMEGKSSDLYKQALSKVGYDNGYEDYSATPHPVHSYSTPPKQTKEIGLKDITDIALTTLAFLSFGMFILQVLMCITMSKDDASNMVMLPMEGTDNTDIPGDDNTEEIRRKRRSIMSTQMQNIQVIDHLAKRALFSLNAVTFMSRDGGACHHYSLCENNKFARSLGDLKKLWIPAWSLGISWLSIKCNKAGNTTLVKNENPVLNSLKAVILGLNNGNCSKHYINKCEAFFHEI